MEHFLSFLQKNPTNLLLFATVIVSGGMLLWPFLTRAARSGRDVSPAEAVQLMNRRDAVVLDVRKAAEYTASHIARARNVPEAEIETRAKELDKVKTKPIVVACARGNTSSKVADRLRKLGFTEVVSLRGGIAAWEQAGLPVEKS